MLGSEHIRYSGKYSDGEYEYRHVSLPYEYIKIIPIDRLMTEKEWRGIGVQQSRGWVHYMNHKPNPHILLFRRSLPKKEGIRMGN